ncbi:MAG: GIY-YIG nuclease family protein [Desulfosarcina sp.]|nr:GIY-YIG nuclease family protein [Desulfosarcina sp.]MBC2741875.1 GIY-YIG nuclease family protein [Desulfosarcina sp.]MBC2764788.1 GIY-YIG nuclease family protein [Desulfosarcina sp.]
MIKLIDLLKIAGVYLNSYKIHCAAGKEDPPLEAFFEGRFKAWQEHQNQQNFRCDEIISLIHMQNDKWLFAGIYQVLGVKHRKMGEKSWFEYGTQEMAGLDHLTGRVVVQFRKHFIASYLIGTKYIDKLMVSEIRDKRMRVSDFPGYNAVNLSYRLLRTVVRKNIPQWKAALSNVGGVYLVTDNHTGKHFVGSANGGDTIWHQWVSYAISGHADIKPLRQLLSREPGDYQFNFQFSILEVFDLNASRDYVDSRAKHWKEVLRSIAFGYNEK